MTGAQYIERSKACFTMAQNPRARGARKDNMQRASWLWLFMWSGMFG